MGKNAQKAAEYLPSSYITKAPSQTALNSSPSQLLSHEHLFFEKPHSFSTFHSQSHDPYTGAVLYTQNTSQISSKPNINSISSALVQNSTKNYKNQGYSLSGAKIIDTVKLDHLWGNQRHDVVFQTTHIYNKAITRHVNGEAQTGTATKATKDATSGLTADGFSNEFRAA